MTLSAQSPAGRLHVCHAGSLTASFTSVEQAFTQQHPTVTIVDAAGGSVDLARRLAAGRLECDVFAPADHLVIDRLLKSSQLAQYTIRFARGRMVLAYLATDPKAATLPVDTREGGQANRTVPQVTGQWFEALTAPGVRIAGAHPFLDPGGYRTHMIFELAQAHYQVPGLYNALLQHYQVNGADPSGPAPALGKDFNFQFTYEHNAAAAAKTIAAYRYAALPPEIDLSREMAGQYAASVITIPGLGIRGSSASVAIPASVVEWGVTIPTNARNPESAVAFVRSLLGPAGRAALTANGPAPMTQARVSRQDYRRLPVQLRNLTAVY